MSGMPESIIPDGISPEIGWRAWEVTNHHLQSMNGTTWMPREALEASCSHPPRLSYAPQRYGPIIPQGRIFREVPGQGGMVIGGYEYGYETSGISPSALPAPAPTVQLPKGWGYGIVAEERKPPEEDCQCGIYALRSKQHLLFSGYMDRGKAVGAVYLWGKIIPGADGFRAQYAYPLAIFTDSKLLNYGVPVRPRGEFGNNIPVRLVEKKKGR